MKMLLAKNKNFANISRKAQKTSGLARASIPAAIIEFVLLNAASLLLMWPQYDFSSKILIKRVHKARDGTIGEDKVAT